jgi:hypothetical protein
MRKAIIRKWFVASAVLCAVMAGVAVVPAGATTWNSALPSIQIANDVCPPGICGQYDSPESLGIPAYLDFASGQGSASSLCFGNQVEIDKCPNLHDATGSTLQNLLLDEFQGIQATMPNSSSLVQVGDGSIGNYMAYELLLAYDDSGDSYAAQQNYLSTASFYDSIVQGAMTGFQQYVDGNLANGNCTSVFGSSSKAAGVINQRIACYSYWELETYNDLYKAFTRFSGSNPAYCPVGKNDTPDCVSTVLRDLYWNVEKLDEVPSHSAYQDFEQTHTPIYTDSPG